MSVTSETKLSIADVFITDELARRVPQKTDYLSEKQALQDLAARMAEQPEAVLPRFVDLAMEMVGGISAGLSLYEENPSPGVFRWRYLRGVLSPFDGATTPRNFSPCGITLDQKAPVLSLHPERIYDWIADANIVVPEVLLVPLYIGGIEPLGTLWIVSDKEGHFDSGHARALTELASFVGIAVKMARTEKQLHDALEEQELVAKEMSHRLKNVFAIADSIIHLSMRGTSNKDDMAEVLSGRFQALARAHALVRRNFSDIAPTAQVSDLADLIRTIVAPHNGSHAKSGATEVQINGPATRCDNDAVNGIALVFHELATNATKYGGLSRSGGRVEIGWDHKDGKLDLTWIERGGPEIIMPPQMKGFGSTLVENTVRRQFQGEIAREWHQDGLVATITMSLDRLSH